MTPGFADVVAPVRSPGLRPDAYFPSGISASGDDLRSGPSVPGGGPLKRLSPQTSPLSGAEKGARHASKNVSVGTILTHWANALKKTKNTE